MCFPSKGANYVICFIPFYTDYRNVEGFHQTFNVRDCQYQVFGCILTVSFIFCKIYVAFCRAFHIKADGKMRWFLTRHQVYQSVGKSKLCIGVFTLTRNAGTTDEGIISTENQREGI